MSLRPALCAAALMLAGCAAVIPVSRHGAGAGWAERRAQLERIDRFTVQARASAGGALSGTASLNWRQNPDGFDLRIWGPFGIGALSLAGDEHQVRVQTRDRTFTTTDPEATLRESLGWTLPIAGLRWWILGLPAPQSAAAITLDDSGRLAALGQDGWLLRYDDYLRAGAQELPRRIELSRADLKIRVVVDAWSGLPPPR